MVTTFSIVLYVFQLSLCFSMPIKKFKSKIFHWFNEPKWLNRLALYSSLGAAVIIIAHLAFSYLGFLHTDVDSARYMLSALVQSEAAIVALVVTLSLVAVQLAASSYSARVIEVFRRTPDLWILMGIYGVAIFYGLGVLKMIENPLMGRVSNLEGQVSFAYYLGVFAFVALVPYIWKTLELLKPSTVINMLAERITKQSILSAIKEEKDTNAISISILKRRVIVEKDPIQPIIDIIRGSMMKYDCETVRDGLKAIGDSTIHIFRNNTLDDDGEYKISEHIFHHLISFGKLAVNKEDEESALGVINTLQENGIATTKLERKTAAEWAIDSLAQIGLAAAERKLEDTTWKVVISLGLVGAESALQKLNLVAGKAAYYIESVGKTAAEKNLKIVVQDAAEVLSLIGETSAVQKLEEATLQTVKSLEAIGIAATKQNLEEVTFQTVKSLEAVGLVTSKNQNEIATRQVVESLLNIGKIATEHKIEKDTLQVALSLQEIGKVAAEYNSKQHYGKLRSP